jgi:hypothetical protein
MQLLERETEQVALLGRTARGVAQQRPREIDRIAEVGGGVSVEADEVSGSHCPLARFAEVGKRVRSTLEQSGDNVFPVARDEVAMERGPRFVLRHAFTKAGLEVADRELDALDGHPGQQCRNAARVHDSTKALMALTMEAADVGGDRHGVMVMRPHEQ